MSYRPERVAHVIRDVVSDAISNRISDPRVHRLTSVTRVEVSGDLRYADVHVSVMGSESDSGTTMKGLQSARGMIQSRLAKRLTVRQCPVIRFHLDRGIKIGIETIRKLDELSAESRPDAETSGGTGVNAADEVADIAESTKEPRSEHEDD
jgi:ribosome-binding factor A